MLLVIDEEMNLVGTLRRRDVLSALTPRFMRSSPPDSRTRIFPVPVDPNLSEMSWDRLESMMLRRSERPVREVMVAVATSVDHEDHVGRVIDAMTEFDVSLVPVTEDDDVIGVVRSVDVLHHVALFILGRGGDGSTPAKED
jgi:predicted transcriptional regulator